MDEPTRDNPAATVRDAARACEPDRYLAALLSPRRARAYLVALAAFLGEVGRIPDAVSDPRLAEIRLQWWREAIGAAPGDRTGSPVADAFRAVLATLQSRNAGVPPRPDPPSYGGNDLSSDPLVTVHDLLDAHAHALHHPPVTVAELETFATRTDGVAFRLAAHIVGDEPAPGAIALSQAGGRAYGLARALASPRTRASIGQPDDVAAASRRHLADARALFVAASPDIQFALLPLALVEPYLRAFQRGYRRPPRSSARVAPLTRVWALWRARRLGWI